MDKALSRSAGLITFGGVSAIAFGVIALAWRGMSLSSLMTLFGAFALVYGVIVLVSGISLVVQLSADSVPYIVSGAAGIAIGAVTLLAGLLFGVVGHFFPITALLLVYLIAVWAIVTGLFEVIAAVGLHAVIKGEWSLGLAGALSVVFGVLVAIRPGAGALAIVWVIGLYAIIVGVMRIAFAYRLRNAQRNDRSVVGA